MDRRTLVFPSYLMVAFVLAIALISGGIVFVKKSLMPPGHIRMAAGPADGAYYAFAERYRIILAQNGLTLTLIETAGSVENMSLLATGQADVALIQGGIEAPEDAAVSALAAVFLEPFFVLHKGKPHGTTDAALWENITIAAGPLGSGTRAAVDSVLEALNLDINSNRFLPIGGEMAAQALMQDDIDVAVFVAPLTAPYLYELLANPDIRIESLRDSEALARQLDYVRLVDIPPAAIDYANRIPPKKIPLTAMVASLVAQDDLHPALVERFVRAAEQIHSDPVILSDTIRFPTAEGVDIPINTHAAEALANGPSALEAYLPYWLTAQIRRVLLILVPLLLMLYPVLRAVPKIFSWQMQKRVYRHYRELLQIENNLIESDPTPEQVSEYLQRLDDIDAKVAQMNMPLRYREYAYALRLHLDLVRRRLETAESA